MKKSGIFTIVLSMILGFILVEGVLASASQAQLGAAHAYQLVTTGQLNVFTEGFPPLVHPEAEALPKSPSTYSQQPLRSGAIVVPAKIHEKLIQDHNRTYSNPPQADRPITPANATHAPNQLLASLQIHVNFSDDWVAGTTDPDATVIITVTDNAGIIRKGDAVVTADEFGDFFVGCEDWFSAQCPDIQPGDRVEVFAAGIENEVNPVGIISGLLDEAENTVTGNLDADWFAGSLVVRCGVWVESGPAAIDTTADTNGGSFSCDFDDVGWDLLRGDTVAVSYFEPDGDQVTNILTWPWVRVNYAHDWIGADYPAGHSFVYTVTDDLGAVKATGSAQTEFGAGWFGAGWGGDGFHSESWSPETPDIQHGDFVYFSADDGYSNTLQVGLISGTIDIITNSLSGQVFAPGFVISLTVECHPWGAWDAGIDAPSKSSWAEPDGSVPFECSWDPNTEWDILPGQDVGVMYLEPDDDMVINVFREPAAYLRIDKSAAGQLAAAGNYRFQIEYWNQGDAPAENVVITDTMVGLSYLSDTSGLNHTGSGAGPIVWDLGTVDPESRGQFDLFVAVTAAESETVTNTAQIGSSSYSQGDPWERQSWWSGHVVPNDTHLYVAKSAWTDDPAPGNDFIFAVNPCNFGGTASTQVTLTDQLPQTMELVYWWAQQPGWIEVTSDPRNLEVAIPTIPGGNCSEVYLRVNLTAEIEPGTPLTNTAWITANNDIESDDNQAFWEGNANEPHINLGISKWWAGGQLVTGGELNYDVSYFNSGNLPVGPFWITDTFPTGTTFSSAWFNDPLGGYPFEPIKVTDEYAVWTIPGLENGFAGDFTVQLNIDPGLTPGTILENLATISFLPGEDTYGDNQAFWTEELFPPGPNLRISKWSSWNEAWQLNYDVAFENVGSETVSNVWITDTMPLDTHWDGWRKLEFDPNRLEDFNFIEGKLVWVFSELNPGEVGSLYFNANLDEPGAPLRWYTNTVEITIPPGDAHPGDNSYQDVAFSGGELHRVEFWLNQYGSSSMWGEAVPGFVVTVTTPVTQVTTFADPNCGGCWSVEDAGTINPGDSVEISAGKGLQPVSVVIPNPIDVAVDADEVYGQVGGWSERPVEVHGNWEGGYQVVTSDPAGYFLAVYEDIPTGGNGYIRFSDEIDYAEVIYHRPFKTLDLVLKINYGHDWVEGVYEPGHTLWITVTEGDGITVKGAAELTTGFVPGWDGQSGFSTNWNGWLGEHPDITPGDWVYGQVDNGFSNAVQVGDIDFEVDYAADIVAGSLSVPGITDPVSLRCELSNHPDNPGIDDIVDPGGGPIYCDFGGSGFDIEPQNTVIVMYWEPDGDQVMNTANWPHMVANIGPQSGGDRHVWGDRVEPGATVALTVTTELGAFVAGTVTQADADGYFDSGRDLPEGSLAFWNIVWADFEDGITDTLEIYPMGGEANPTTDVVTVTAAGPPFFSVSLEYCRFEACDEIDLGEIGESGVVAVDLMAERGHDVQPGDSFHAHLNVWNGHEVIYSWGLPAPELGVWKWHAGNYAQPGGVAVYGVRIQNNGNGPAEDVHIVDILPPNTFYAGDTSGYPVTVGPGNMITWELGTIEPDQTMNFFVTLDVDPYIPTGSGIIDQNCATISTISEGDWNPDNDQTCSELVDVWEDVVDLSISKSAEPNDPSPGQEFNYNIQWCNHKGAAAGPVVLTDTLPAGTALFEWYETQPWMHFWSEVSYDGNQLVLYAPGLPGDSCESIQLRTTLDPEVPISTTLENLVVIDVAGDVNTHNNWYLGSIKE